MINDNDWCNDILLVKFESKKHELEDVDSAEQLQLECSVVSDTPDTDGDAEDADHDQGDEHEDPLVSPGVQVVRSEQFKHEEQQVD